jgi:hypothetical protein
VKKKQYKGICKREKNRTLWTIIERIKNSSHGFVIFREVLNKTRKYRIRNTSITFDLGMDKIKREH